MGHIDLLQWPADDLVSDDPVLQELGRQHDATPTEIALAYLLQQGNTAVIPRSCDPDRIATNVAAAAVRLSDEDLMRIGGLARGCASVGDADLHQEAACVS